MERLTIRNSDGTVSQPTSTTIEAAFYRLAAYEDTGLEPEDLRSNEDIDFARVVELLRADAEGRLVVLPCKEGEQVWIAHSKKYPPRETFFGSRSGILDEMEAGCVFGKTREDAEAALQKEETP